MSKRGHTRSRHSRQAEKRRLELQNALKQAITARDTKRIRDIGSRGFEHDDLRSGDETYIHLVARMGDAPVLEALLDCATTGIADRQTDDDDGTPLGHACVARRYACVEMLLNYVAHPHCGCTPQVYPLPLGRRWRWRDRLMLDHGGFTPLQWACLSGDARLMEILLADLAPLGPDYLKQFLAPRDCPPLTPLALAVLADRVKITERLLKLMSPATDFDWRDFSDARSIARHFGLRRLDRQLRDRGAPLDIDILAEIGLIEGQ